MMEYKCLICGTVVPEGRQVCPECVARHLPDTAGEIKRLEEENQRLSILLFAVVRNSAVYPIGRRLGKSEGEISRKTLETIRETEKVVDFDRMRALMALGAGNEVNDENDKEDT